MAEGGLHWQAASHEAVAQARAAAACIIDAEPGEIAFTKNVTEGITQIAQGLRWQPGDNVVTADAEYPANVFPWRVLERDGVELRLVHERDGRIALDDLRSAMDARTRVLALSFVEFASGFRNNLAAVGELCRKHGALFVVDAVQGLGVMRLNARAMGIAALVTGGHKWLLAPEGTGFLYIAREVMDQVGVVQFGADSVVGADAYLEGPPSAYGRDLLPDARRYEGGTLNTTGIHGLGAALDLLGVLGADTIEARVLALTDILAEGLAARGYQVVSPRAIPGERSGIVSFRSERAEAKELCRRCEAAGIVVTPRAGCVRASPHAYNSEAEIEALLDALP